MAIGSEVWGLTGGVASGKSTAARFFSDAGIPVLDADTLARRLTAPGGAAEKAVRSEFGTTDRTQLRDLVFGDSAKRARLESILHPLIRTESELQIAALTQIHPKGAVIYEASLLVESGRSRDFAGLIVVDAARALRKARLMARSQISDDLAEKILDAQAPDEIRRKAATVTFDNSGHPDSLRTTVASFIYSRGW